MDNGAPKRKRGRPKGSKNKSNNSSKTNSPVSNDIRNFETKSPDSFEKKNQKAQKLDDLEQNENLKSYSQETGSGEEDFV